MRLEPKGTGALVMGGVLIGVSLELAVLRQFGVAGTFGTFGCVLVWIGRRDAQDATDLHYMLGRSHEQQHRPMPWVDDA